MKNLYEFHSNFRFVVTVGTTEMAAFTEVRLPTLQVETKTLQEGGQNSFVHKLPVRVDVGTVTLKGGLTSDLKLLRWYEQVLKGNIKEAMREVTISMLDVGRQGLVTWTLRRAYPVKWVGPSLQADSRTVAIEELELAHHGFEFKA